MERTPSGLKRRETLPDRDQTLAQLERILSSSSFRRAERLGQFLRFIVVRAVDGKLEDLKETVIGVEVYGRDPGYDPRTAPIVRTEARRLRAKLIEYEETAGEADEVAIRLPTGGYVPTFELRAQPHSLPEVLPKPAAQPVSRRLIIGSAILGATGVILGVGILAVSSRQPPDPYRNATVTPLSSYSGSEFSSSLSPDGHSVAFVWDGGEKRFEIYIKTIGEETPRRLTRTPAQDLNPAWSPDGQQIAFLRSWSDQRKQLIVVPSRGGRERIVADLHPANSPWTDDASLTDHLPGPAWSPDGNYLAAADRCGDSDARDCIYLIALDSAERKKVTAPEAGTLGDSYPRFSPDGSSLAVIRTLSARGISDIFIQPLSGSPARRLSNDRKTVSSLAWAGDQIFFSSNRAGGNALWHVAAGGGQPERIAAAGLRVSGVAADRLGKRLVFTDSFVNTNIWRVALGASFRKPAEPEKLIASTRKNDSAQYSPDGTRICFISDRTGTPQVWVVNADGSGPFALTSLAPATPVGTPRWSPDGRTIVFDSTYHNHSAIFEIPSTGGQPKLLSDENDVSLLPSWSHDGRWVFFVRRRGTESELWKKPVGGGPASRVLAHDRWDALEAPDGSAIYFARDETGIWELPANAAAPAVIPELKDVAASRHFAVAPGGIYFADAGTLPAPVRFFDFKTRRVANVFAIDKPLALRTPSLSVSPNGKWLLYAETDDLGADLMMLQLQ